MNIPALLNNRYETKGEIGQGAMGVVIKALDRTTGGEVAIKIVADTGNRLALQRFESEWKTLRDLRHPTIVLLFDRGEFLDGNLKRPFFVMPLIPGNTLEELIYGRTDRPEIKRIVPEDLEGINRIVNIIYSLCGGLLAAHNRKVIHRDLKPSNIVIVEGDAVQIIDFGVAHFTEKNTRTAVRGTPAYIAPELISPGSQQKPSPESDIFSVAVIAYEALTRIQPFEREDNRETMHALLHEMPKPVSDLNGKVNLAISKVIQRALAKKPEHRFPNAMDFAEKLRQACSGKLAQDFDREIIASRVKAISDACGDTKFDESKFKKAHQLLDVAQLDEGLVDPQLDRFRQRVDQALRRSRVEEAIREARDDRDKKQFKEALRKLRDVSKMADVDADLRASARSLETQIESESIRDHQDNAKKLIADREFAKAREELERSRKIRPQDTQTLELTVEVDRREEGWRKLQGEKEALFREAQKCYQAGEFAAALNRIDRIEALDETGNELSAAWEKAYEAGRDEIRAEYEKSTRALQECEGLLDQSKFDEAVAICDQALARYPTQTVFGGLKLNIEEKRRQKRLEFLLDLDARLNKTADLQARVVIVQEAVKASPSQAELQEILQMAKAKRDLVESLVEYARETEEREDFSEALEKWEAVKRCHPLHPHLDANVERVKRRREDQALAERKRRYIQEIETRLGRGEYPAAKKLCEEALKNPELAKDAEFNGLQSIVLDSIWKSAKADELVAEGQQQLAENQLDLAIDTFRRAFGSDPHKPSVREALGTALTKKAKQIAAGDWSNAEPLIREADGLFPGNADIAALSNLVADRKQSAYEQECLKQARDLEFAKKLVEALEKIREGRGVYPRNNRLIAAEEDIVAKLRAAGHNVEISSRASRTTAPSDEVLTSDQPTAQRPASGSSMLVQDALSMAGGTVPQTPAPAIGPPGAAPAKTAAAKKAAGLGFSTFGRKVSSSVAAARKAVMGWSTSPRTSHPPATGQENPPAAQVPVAPEPVVAKSSPRTKLLWQSMVKRGTWEQKLAIAIGGLAVALMIVAVILTSVKKTVPAMAFTGTATVQPLSAYLREYPDGAGEILVTLKRSTRVNVLERPTAEKQPFTRVQYVDGKNNSRPGYIRTSDLGNWASNMAAVEWAYVQWDRPPEGSSEAMMRQFAEELQGFSDRFAGAPEAGQANLEEAKLYIAIAANLKNSGRPASDWGDDLAKADRILQSIQSEPEAANLGGEIAELRRPQEGAHQEEETAQSKQITSLYNQARILYNSEDPAAAAKAKPLLRKILELDPHHTHARSLLEQILEYEK